MSISKKMISLLLSITLLAAVGCGNDGKKQADNAPAQKKELKYICDNLHKMHYLSTTNLEYISELI